MGEVTTVDRRSFLRNLAGASAGLVAAPSALTWLTGSPAAAATADPMLPFVAHYTTNLSANLTASTNAAVDILSGMARLWRTGDAWNTGVVLDPEILRANMRYCAHVTRTRTLAEAKKAFIYDRQDQSYAVLDGLGPLAGIYKTGARAVTSITAAPDGTPPTTINDGVPVGAPAGSATGAGSAGSDLGTVVTLVQTLRGNYSSGNPAKSSYQYPRPWRMNENSQVVDTGQVDGYGYPVYESTVEVAPQLLRQRSLIPASDGGFPSGHTNAFFLASLALAYAVPERFQEIITRAYELADTRIIAGMHSAVDVVGGRILGTALAAAILNDPANARLKGAARAQALTYFTARTGTDDLYAYAHSADIGTDPYADRDANARSVAPRFTYILPRTGKPAGLDVPAGAEVLLETRLSYLDAGQRREVLRTTALPAGYPLLDGPEQWGRLNLFAAADGYGAFDTDVRVTMNAADGGFSAADTWRNNIGGRGGLVKLGTGALTLTGANSYAGGTQISGGTLVAAAADALGTGDVQVNGGTLQVTQSVRIHGDFHQSAGTLDVSHGLVVTGTAGVAGRLVIRTESECGFLPVLTARHLTGRFGSVTVTTPGLRAEPIYTPTGVFVRVTRTR